MELRRLALLGAALGTALFSSLGLAQSPCEPMVARLVSAQGVVEARADAASAWRPAALNDILCPGYMVRVGNQSRAALFLSNDTVLRLDQHTTLTFSGVENRENSWLDLISGVVHFISRVPRALTVKTPFVNAAVEGTEFVVSVARNEASVTVFEGRVWAENAAGRLVLDSGQTAVAQAGQAPAARVLLRPRDAVQWALYFPPLLDRRLAATPAFTKSFAAYYSGDVAGAIAALDVPGTTADARLLTHRAALRLVVGRVDEARADIARAQALDSRNVHALALQSIIALLQNEKDRALTLAREATTQDPHSTPALIALSYAQQAAFDIEGATASAERALVADPDDTYARARLAELRLSLGDLEGALAAAQRAVATDARSARAHTVLGFAHLTRIDIAEARHAFEQAIERDSADPLPRLGLGLAKIRKGKLEEGRREIEIAASLDPNNALARSYLGKAYYEEKRDGLAGSQLTMAKSLDDKDPTPWLYDAIRKQTENRPVEALHDLQKSIELNDNRAVYRSRLLLDGDLAARGTSLARIYNDLGFEQLALLEGAKSLAIDSSNYSAHRFLSEIYAKLPRHKIARDSELLQSQLLQPISIAPVPARLGDNGIAFLDDVGLGDVGFNEYSPLFVSDQIRLLVDGIGGDNDTFSDNLILSGVERKLSFSLSQFHFETDGIRANNDFDQDIYNVFLQYTPTPTTSLHVELRKVEQESGYQFLLFDPDNFFLGERDSTEDESIRFGLRHNIDASNTFLGSFVHREFSERLVDEIDPFSVFTDDDANFVELRHLLQKDSYRLTGGAGRFSSDLDQVVTFGSSSPDMIGSRITHNNAYVYGSIDTSKDLTLTFGLSYDSFDSDTRKRRESNPKFGLVWRASDNTTIRAAAFRALKRLVVSSQTLEPTQIAGFNQFFDDPNATISKRYGIAIDRIFADNLFAGLEISRRDLDVSRFRQSEGGFVDDPEEENLGISYLYWTLNESWTFGAEFHFERNIRDPEAQSMDFATKLRRRRVPLELRYFHPSSGFFARGRATYVDLDGQFLRASGEIASGRDNFWTVDAFIGYRLKKRKGVLSIGIRNLFDTDFEFQDTDPTNALIVPERMVQGRFTITFP